MSGSSADLFRATIVHTPEDPFRLDPADPSGLAAYRDGCLAVEGGRVCACGEFDEVRRKHPDSRVIDRRGSFILPGFVDAHVHYPQLRIIGAMGLTLLEWLDRVALPEECRMADEGYAAATARRFLRALASNGTTTALVFGPHFTGAAAVLFEKAESSGLRIISGLTVSDRRLRPELHVPPLQAYKESGWLIERFHKRGRLLYAVTPRFALSASDAMLEVCQQLLSEHPDVRLQTHINENHGEIDERARLFPWAADYLAVYEKYGLSTSRSVMAHNVHVTNDELERMASSRTAVAHCPCSNAMLGSGIFPLKRHVEAGITCALGTDVGGGTGFGIMKEALAAYQMQRVSLDGMPLNPARLLFMATSGGAKAVGLSGEIGDFSPGKSADFVCLKPAPGSVLDEVVLHAADLHQALAAMFTMAGPESVVEVRVAGDVVFEQAAA